MLASTWPASPGAEPDGLPAYQLPPTLPLPRPASSQLVLRPPPPLPCRKYFASVWNYLDLSSYTLMAVVFVLHLTRANNQLFRILVALQALLLCMRSLYFLLAIEHMGGLVRMVVQVGGQALALACPEDLPPD